MIYIKSFSNYEGFKEVFGFIEHGNGVKSRKNKILLGVLKDRKFIHRCLGSEKDAKILSITSMAELKNYLRDYVCRHTDGSYCLCFNLPSISAVENSIYMLDNLKGICQDMDTACIRYVNIERDKVFKMKAGKFITNILNDSPSTAILPEQAKRWIGEEFAREWKAYASSKTPDISDLELHVGDSCDDFSDIYDSDKCKGDFGSCMTNKDQYTFYVDAIDASAACLKDSDGYIVARCIIYNKVIVDSTGEVLRLAERQYSSGEDNVLKQVLVDRLIEWGFIDGYKRVGASCHDAMDFVRNNGDSLQVHMHISNTISEGDTLSYQDTFKWLDMDDDTAYNYSCCSCTHELDTTDETLRDAHDGMTFCEYDEEWYDDDCVTFDDYHEVYIHVDDATTAKYNGREITIDGRRTEDFRYSEYYDTWIHEDDCTYVDEEYDYFYDSDVVQCDFTEDYILESNSAIVGRSRLVCRKDDAVYSSYHGFYLYEPDAVHSDITDDYYEDEDSMLKDEVEYRNQHAIMCVSA